MCNDVFILTNWVSYQRSKKMIYMFDSKNKKEYIFKGTSFLILDYFIERENEMIDNITNCLIRNLAESSCGFEEAKVKNDIVEFVETIKSKGLCIKNK